MIARKLMVAEDRRGLAEITRSLHDAIVAWYEAEYSPDEGAVKIPILVSAHRACLPLCALSQQMSPSDSEIVTLVIQCVESIEVSDSSETGAGPLNDIRYDSATSSIILSTHPSPLRVVIRVRAVDVFVMAEDGDSSDI